VNDRIPHAEPDHVLVDVKAKAFGGLRPALTPTPGAVPEQRAGCRPQDIHKFRSLRLQGIAGCGPIDRASRRRRDVSAGSDLGADAAS